MTAARIAPGGDGCHHVSLEEVIKTMKEVGADMKDECKRTARCGLAVDVTDC